MGLGSAHRRPGLLPLTLAIGKPGFLHRVCFVCVTGRYGRCRSVGASDCGCDPTDSTDILNPEIPPPEESLHFSFRHILLRHYIIVLSSSLSISLPLLRVKVTRFFALILFLLLCSALLCSTLLFVCSPLHTGESALYKTRKLSCNLSLCSSLVFASLPG